MRIRVRTALSAKPAGSGDTSWPQVNLVDSSASSSSLDPSLASVFSPPSTPSTSSTPSTPLVSSTSPALSIIVPVYNEEEALPAFLRMLDSWHCPREVIFSDGGSTDATLKLLRGRAVVCGPKGRGGQCQRGVAASHGSGILFLHVDTRIQETALEHIEQALARGVIWGCLTVDFSSHAPEYQFGIRKSNLRARIGGTPFGDQGMFMTRAALDQVGGVPDICIMEDYELSRRLRRAFGWPKQLPDRIVASVRRFEVGNRTLIGMQMAWLRLRYRLGTSPERIQQLYGDVREKSLVKPEEAPEHTLAERKEAHGRIPLKQGELCSHALAKPEEAPERLSGQVVILFTRVPVPGKAKTRLSPVLTPQQAADVQRALIADTVGMLSLLNRDILVCYAPDHADQSNAQELLDDFKTLLNSCWHRSDSASPRMSGDAFVDASVRIPTCGFDGTLASGSVDTLANVSASDSAGTLANAPAGKLLFAPQRGASLGERMDDAFATAFSMGAHTCLLMGSDIPGVRSSELEEMFQALDGADVLLAPSDDGGYWLVGLKERFSPLFAEREFSTASVFKEAQRTCATYGRTLVTGSCKPDVDCPADLARCQELFQHDAHAAQRSPHLAALLGELGGGAGDLHAL